MPLWRFVNRQERRLMPESLEEDETHQ